jgi:hypothetical protein
MAAAVMLAAGTMVVALGCGGTSRAGSNSVNLETRAAPSVLELSSGSYRGVAVGDSIERAQAVLGSVEPVHDELVAPLGSTVESYRGSVSGGVEAQDAPVHDFIYRYDDAVLLVIDRKIVLIGVGEPGARTETGVSIGGPLDFARTTYPQLQCGQANEGGEGPVYPACSGRIGDGYVWIGDDPIRYIELGTAPFSF